MSCHEPPKEGTPEYDALVESLNDNSKRMLTIKQTLETIYFFKITFWRDDCNKYVEVKLDLPNQWNIEGVKNRKFHESEAEEVVCAEIGRMAYEIIENK